MKTRTPMGGHDFAQTLAKRPLAYTLAVLLLAIFLAVGWSSLLRKCATSDEVVHLLAGYSYWTTGDYRVDPENGNLPQRWMALPLLFADIKLPSFNDLPQLNQWKLAQLFFYELGNDPNTMLRLGRSMMALLAAGLGVVVYAWSSHLFGRAGGLLSLLLYCFSTAILANGSLMTSDLTAALLFLASVSCMWWTLERVTAWRVVASAVVMGLLFVAKMSAVLIVLMGLLLIAVRLLHGSELIVEMGSSTRRLATRTSQAAAVGVMLVAHAAVVILVIWAFYGFRYAALAPTLAGREQLDAGWNTVMASSFPMRGAIAAARSNHLLPEAYLYGQAYVLQQAQSRWAFLDGRYGTQGWWWFFPYCFAAKTSLWLFVVMALAVGAAVQPRGAPPKRKRAGSEPALAASLYRSAPLWVLLAVYWAVAITSNLNIGHRHILVTYPVLFILCGSAVHWFDQGRKSAWAWVLGISLVGYAAEAAWIWPNYLTYFNPLFGGSAQGYRRLVDSSSDWGQDLPGLKVWLESRGLQDPAAPPVYLSYFGTGSPTWHGIQAHRLAGYVDADLGGNRPFVELRAGTYCISASMLPMVLTEPRGPWSTFYEREYRQAAAEIVPFLALPSRQQEERMQADPQQVSQLLFRFDALRLGRLIAYLRHRQPDDDIGHSILIYKLGDKELEQALHGPAVEAVPADGPLR